MPEGGAGVTLWRYLLRSFLRACLVVFAAIALVILLFGFVENLRRFGDGALTGGEMLQVTLLQAPDVLYQVFPLVLMLASLVTFLGLSRTSELVVMRAAGISAIRLITVPAMAAMVIGIGFVMAVNPFVAASIRRSVAMEDQVSRSASLLSFSIEGLWLRQADDGGGQTVIQAARANAEGTILLGVRLHRFDADGQLFARIEAPSARLISGAWQLPAATQWLTDAGGAFQKTLADTTMLLLPTTLTGAQILDSFSPPEMVGIWALPGFIAQMEDAGFSAIRHRLFLQGEVAKPVLFAAMVLIGAAFALRPTRFGQTGVMMLLAVLCGFLLYFVTDFSATLGAQGQIPLPVAVWTPPVAAILLATALLLHLEDG